MAKFSYQPKGVCSVQIDFEVEDGVVRNVHFTRGCNGNTQGISALVEGMNIDDVISRLKGYKTVTDAVRLALTSLQQHWNKVKNM